LPINVKHEHDENMVGSLQVGHLFAPLGGCDKNPHLYARTLVWFVDHNAGTKVQRHRGTKEKRDKGIE